MCLSSSGQTYWTSEYTGWDCESDYIAGILDRSADVSVSLAAVLIKLVGTLVGLAAYSLAWQVYPPVCRGHRLYGGALVKPARVLIDQIEVSIWL